MQLFVRGVWVEGGGQDTTQYIKGGCGSMLTILPKWGLEAKMGPKHQNLNQKRQSFNFETILFASKKQAI